MTAEWLLIGLLLALGLVWWEGLHSRERAVRAARRACAEAGVQLLDESVALTRLRLQRGEDQRVRLYREYAFEYSDTGDNRLPGRVYLLGARVLDVSLIVVRAIPGSGGS
ncbi:MAG: DUF3301 domain-containing protein [Thiobacillaceae bacterium]|nr:DUF3301 domain-containing protein [Thiobacillaceae bacterium]MDW8322758.1 DUF3301 domain-containing protein [Burkholderiales bacterium]